MKIRYLIYAASAALLAGFALYSKKSARPAQALLEPPAGKDQDDTVLGYRTDADALSALSAINLHEIASAEIVQNKLTGGPLLQYARMLQQQHSENQRLTQELSRNTGVTISDLNAAVVQLKAKAKSERDQLNAVDGDAFEATYLDAMIQSHSEVLELIDNDLLPASARADVDRHLRETRTHLAAHLEKAKTLKDSLAAA